MQIPSTRDRAEVGANMTPMIDVVFLLIIFFLVSSHLARQEHHMPLELPLAATFIAGAADEPPLTISVDLAAIWYVGGRTVDLGGLREVLDDHFSRTGAAAAIRVRTDGRIAYRHVEPILREAAKAGITDIKLAVRDQAATGRTNGESTR